MAKKTMAYVVYPGISLLELVGTRSLLGSIAAMGADYQPVVVGETKESLATDTPMAIIPQKTFDEVPQPEALVVIGGGADTLPALENERLLHYIRQAGEQAELVAGVSTGSLLLAAAGLLKNRRATTHWAYASRLRNAGIAYQPEPWVEDGKFVTAAGVSGGIDMAIGYGAKLAKPSTAKMAQLMIEYDPHPPMGNIDWGHLDQFASTQLMERQPGTGMPVQDIAFVIYPDLTVFDLVGPLQVISTLNRLHPEFRPLVVAEQAGPVSTDIGIHMVPNLTFDQLPKPAGFVVPGGDTPTLKAMSNPVMRRYILNAAPTADWIVSVCTGALILASVGLLRGCDVTTHWAYRHHLKAFGARYVQKRWTHNGKIINSAGVSAGIDMALYLTSKMAGEDVARQVQLIMQYDPQPPFGGIDYDHMGTFPRVLRTVNGLLSYAYTSKPRRMIRQGI
jgi:transcriptional regulator GlxA family with amidase domain